MITRTNLKEVIASITPKDAKRIKNSSKEYCVIYLHCFNAGSYATITLTNNFSKFSNVSDDGNCILETGEVAELLS